MMRKKHKEVLLPTMEQIEQERERLNYRRRFRNTLGGVLAILIVVAAAAVLISSMLLPVFRIYGASMTPTLEAGDMVAAIRTEELKQGELIAFYYNNKILVKRVIAGPGEWVNIDDSGNVYVNDQLLDEPYLVEKSLGQCDIELPYQVPEEQYFVMGDHREVSVDSRVSTVGCVSQEQLAGRLILKIWPLARFGIVS